MSLFSRSTNDALDASQALPGHPDAVVLTDNHAVLGTPMQGPFPEGLEQIVFGMGCYWGAERKLWQVPGVYTTAVGYAGGFTPNPTYRETCTGRTGHTEAVLVVFDPTQVSVEDLLRVFWEGHDPTQKNRQGNDVGTQYRSGIYTTTPEQLATAQASRATYQDALSAAHKGQIETEIVPLTTFYYEGDAVHQQYLHKNPAGYCGLGGTGVSCPIGVGISAD
jgi:peptide-methionine (S)-S-oxide reductase